MNRRLFILGLMLLCFCALQAQVWTVTWKVNGIEIKNQKIINDKRPTRTDIPDNPNINCGKEFVYWDAAVDKENKCLRDDFYCPYCNAIHSKNNISKVYESVFDAFMNKTISRNKSVPVVLVYTVNKKRFEKVNQSFLWEIRCWAN